MIYAYTRVSTDKQDNDNQRSSILEYANKHNLGKVEFISETVSSRRADREIFRLLDTLQKGDTLVIFELSRLGRSMNELRSILVKLSEGGVTLHAISQNLAVPPDGTDITTHALIFAFSISAQIERQMISDRTRNALQARRAKGLTMGRPAGKSRLDEHEDAIKKYLGLGLNVANIAKIIDPPCNQQTLANWMKAKGLKKLSK